MRLCAPSFVHVMLRSQGSGNLAGALLTEGGINGQEDGLLTLLLI